MVFYAVQVSDMRVHRIAMRIRSLEKVPCESLDALAGKHAAWHDEVVEHEQR